MRAAASGAAASGEGEDDLIWMSAIASANEDWLIQVTVWFAKTVPIDSVSWRPNFEGAGQTFESARKFPPLTPKGESGGSRGDHGAGFMPILEGGCLCIYIIYTLTQSTKKQVHQTLFGGNKSSKTFINTSLLKKYRAATTISKFLRFDQRMKHTKICHFRNCKQIRKFMCDVVSSARQLMIFCVSFFLSTAWPRT